MEALPLFLSAAVAGALTYVFHNISVFLAVAVTVFMLTYVVFEKV